MNSRCWFLLVLIATNAGCVGPFFQSRREPELVPIARPSQALPVTAEEVTEANAREKARALKQELDRDADEDKPAGPSEPPAAPKAGGKKFIR